MTVTENLLAFIIRHDEAAAGLKVCRPTLDRWRRLREGRPMTEVGRRVLCRRSSLLAWLRAQEHQGRE